jgi:CTP:molybdopterin cytidylyltransferase MocA
MLGGQSLTWRGIAMLRAGGADPVIVVTGAAGPGELGQGRQMPGDVRTVHNPDWPTGMGSSLAVGLTAVPGECTAAVIALADQPLVGPVAVSRLIAAHLAGASVAVSCYDGRPRNPVLISREHWPEVIRLAAGDVGARPFLRAHPELVTQVECGDTGQPDDVDTRADLARVERLVEQATTFP